MLWTMAQRIEGGRLRHLNSSTMIVMMTAITPSLNASSLPVPHPVLPCSNKLIPAA